MKWRIRLLAVVGCLAGFGTFSQTQAQAQTDDGAPPGYDQLIDKGLREYDEYQFEEARNSFREAHGLFPNARTFRVLGMVEFELEHYPESLEYSTSALNSMVRPLDDKLRKKVEDLVRRARQYVALIHLELQPPSAQVLVDGVLTQVGAGRTLVLRAGTHELVLLAESYRSVERKLVVVGGEEQTLRETLSRELFPEPQQQQPAPTPPVNQGSRDSSLWVNPWFWAAVGTVAAVGAAVGLAVALRPDPRTEFGAPVKTGQTPAGVQAEALGVRW
jgi:hypothetical protein